MGSKTILFSKKIERKTYVQGDFIGKYNGTLIKNQYLDAIAKVYDIYIYEGKISNVINQVDNYDVVNESVYQSIKSHLLLEQKSFENVVCVPEGKIDDYDGFKLHIKEPKLQNILIKDVLKEGDSTFGTITCRVTGYLIDYIVEEDQIEIEICDDCTRPIEDCNCVKTTNLPFVLPIIEENPIPKRHQWSDGYSWSGCFTGLGLVLGVLFLLFLGLPSLVILLVVAIGYAISRYGVLVDLWNKLISLFGFLIIAFFVLGILVVLVDKCSNESKGVYSPSYKFNKPVNPYIKDNKTLISVVPKDSAQEIRNTVKKEEKKVNELIQKPIAKPLQSKSVYICNGKYANRYHLSPYCRGLSNCKSTVSSITLDDVRASGRTLCGWED